MSHAWGSFDHFPIDPSVAAAKLAAMDAKREASTRVAQCSDAVDQVRLDIVVTANDVTCRIPKISLAPGQKDTLMARLRDGVTLELKNQSVPKS
ncbi:hypothetical protein [Polaromonas naphthalenivorans]|uniref:Uncharacterized protein n=1 Tax=Polaromonas naphthalenivorans (strain CJ2) TaxID=365044 RepID=A1VVM6_POLNA|nr:hypothetical protein [Polaromonas naphthalenivorans]ABM39704.1 hypothetical protein Pnap_4427 [Polaromonas naphthalenivorans CJ2]